MADRRYCEFGGCKDLARPADIEYAEWHPDDKRPIYCDRHCNYVDKFGAPKRPARPVCQMDACTFVGIEHCFWCRKRVCYGHAYEPFKRGKEPDVLVKACETHNAMIKRTWAKQRTAESPYE